MHYNDKMSHNLFGYKHNKKINYTDMKAIVYSKYGPPEVAKLLEVPKPSPKNNQVLVKVHASTVNRTDAGFRSAEYFVSRFFTGLFRPKHQILGCEFAGVVDEIVKGVL